MASGRAKVIEEEVSQRRSSENMKACMASAWRLQQRRRWRKTKKMAILKGVM
jgi:hypothetical protein